MQGMLIHSELHRRHSRPEIKQAILQEDIYHNVEG